MPNLAGQLRAIDAGTTEFVSGADDPVAAAEWLARLGHDFTILEDAAVKAATARLAQRLTDASM